MLSKHHKLFSGAIFLVFAAAIAVQIPSIAVTNLAANSRLMPIVIAVLLAAFGLPLCVEGAVEFLRERQKKAEDAEPSPGKKVGLLRLLLCAVLFAGYAFFLTRLGFVVSSIVYLFANFLVLAPKEKRNFPLFALLAVGIPIAIYAIFVKGFRVILPIGKWFL